MRLGLLGPSEEGVAILREAIEFLLFDAGVESLIYLGDGPEIDRVVRAWTHELLGGEARSPAFLARILDVVARGNPDDIDALLQAEAAAERLESVRALPPPPARAVEMIDDRVVLLVHDKSVLEEEDIANANLIVYGRSEAADLRRFGPRLFFTPGPASARQVGLLDQDPEGLITLSLFDVSGAPLWVEPIAGRGSKVSISR